MNIELLIEKLQLKPHPEGGYFRETYRSFEMLSQDALPGRYGQKRPVSTCIYYLLTPETFSCLHLVQSDEIFHFYAGDAVEQLLLYPDGRSETRILGRDIVDGQQMQAVVPHGIWQGARLVRGGTFALFGCTVAPGFDFSDYREGERAELIAAYPEQAALISQLTRR